MKSVLVTGGNGFVGREVVKQLCLAGEFNVYSASRSVSEQRFDEICICNDQIFAEEDWLGHIDCVINCAFSRSNAPQDLAQGLEFTDKLFQSLKSAKVNNIINISSQGVYLQKQDIDCLNEGDEIGPSDAYGVAKYATELMLYNVFNGNENITNIRLASVNMPQRFTQAFINSIIQGKEINLVAPKQKTSLIDVRDVAAGLIAIAKNDKIRWRKVYNLGTGRYESIGELLDCIVELCKPYVNNVPSIIRGDSAPKAFAYMSIDAMKTDFNWQPTVSAKEMLSNMLMSSQI